MVNKGRRTSQVSRTEKKGATEPRALQSEVRRPAGIQERDQRLYARIQQAIRKLEAGDEGEEEERG